MSWINSIVCSVVFSLSPSSLREELLRFFGSFAAGAGTLVEVNGLFGAALDIGGDADDDAAGAGTLVEVNGLFGAALDIGGDADDDAAGAGKLVEVNGLYFYQKEL
jgi:hypothetical protein